jgi:RNA recognition motif-containing protein
MLDNNYTNEINKPIELDDYSILIKNLTNKLSKEDLRRIFKNCGEIKKINLIRKEKSLIDAKIIFEMKESLNLVIIN